jgi:hypothetical protein
VDPVPDPLFFPGIAGNRTRVSGSVAKNSDHYIYGERERERERETEREHIRE